MSAIRMDAANTASRIRAMAVLEAERAQAKEASAVGRRGHIGMETVRESHNRQAPFKKMDVPKNRGSNGMVLL